VSDGRVVREHRDNHLALASIGNFDYSAPAQFNECLTLGRGSVEHDDVVSGFYQVRRHCRAHSTQPDKSNLHVVISVALSTASLNIHIDGASVSYGLRDGALLLHA
jgi:hypothetical protein